MDKEEILVETDKPSKSEALKRLIATYSDSPMQGSEEWHRARHWSIGGSSIAVYLGQNVYRTAIKEIEMRICETDDFNEKATSWGNMFEQLAKEWVEKEWSLNILGEDIFVKHPDLKGMHYSPDGLSCGVLDESIGEQIILHEFKCPYSRPLNGEVPQYYVPQVMMGLSLVPEVEVGLFSQFLFRVTSLEGLSDPMHYSPSIHRNQRGTLKKHPVACGAIIFDGSQGSMLLGDIGALKKNADDMRMQAYSNGSGVQKYTPVMPYNGDSIAFLRGMIDAEKPRNFLIWKLFDVEHFVIERDANYLADNMATLAPFIDTYAACAATQSKVEQKEHLKKLLWSLERNAPAKEKDVWG